MLFADIAFTRKSRRILKWTTGIRVEIKNIEELDREAIEEVDSIIAILSPLIAPLSMERVNSGGNLHIYRAVDTAPLSSRPRKIVHLNGLAKINSETPLSWDIKYAHIYDGKHVRTQTLMHEFEHALGLEHPFRLYEYYLTIGRSAIPQHYTAYGGWLRFHSMPYYISPQEKAAIRLLYSPAIRPGLHHDTFTRGMDLE